MVQTFEIITTESLERFRDVGCPHYLRVLRQDPRMGTGALYLRRFLCRETWLEIVF